MKYVNDDDVLAEADELARGRRRQEHDLRDAEFRQLLPCPLSIVRLSLSCSLRYYSDTIAKTLP